MQSRRQRGFVIRRIGLVAWFRRSGRNSRPAAAGRAGLRRQWSEGAGSAVSAGTFRGTLRELSVSVTTIMPAGLVGAPRATRAVPRVGGRVAGAEEAVERPATAGAGSVQAAKAIAAQSAHTYRRHAGAGCAMRGRGGRADIPRGARGHRKCRRTSEAIHRGGSAGSSFFPQDLPPGGSNPRGDRP